MTAVKRGADYVPWCSRPTRAYRHPIREGWTPMVPSGELAPVDEHAGDCGEPERVPCTRCGRKVRFSICRLGQCSLLENLASAPEREIADIKRRANGRHR